MKLRDASYFPFSPLFHILGGVKVCCFRLLLNRFNIIQNKHLPLLNKLVLNIDLVYDEEQLLLKRLI
jgi:hypothetical protein